MQNTHADYFSKNLRIELKELIAALAVAVVAAIFAVLFVKGYSGITAFLYQKDPSTFQIGRSLTWLPILILPVVGLLVGLITKFVMPGGIHAVFPDLLAGIHQKPGRISFREGFGVALVAAIGIGGGASVGRFGPGAHFGAATGASVANLLGFNYHGRLTMIGAGGASFVAAMFGLPMAAPLFMLEALLHRTSSIRLLVPLLLSGFIGNYIGRLYLGPAMFSNVSFQMGGLLDFVPIILVLAPLCVLGVLFYRHVLIQANTLGNKIPLPLWVKPILGGVVLGAIGFFLPAVLSLSVPAISQFYQHTWISALPWISGSFFGILGFLVLFFFMKGLVTGISFGFGFNGGLVAPIMLLGIVIGAFVGELFLPIMPNLDYKILIVVGSVTMVSLFFGSPIAMVVAAFELSRSFDLLLPTIVGIAVAHTLNYYFMKGRSHFEPIMEKRGIPLATSHELQILQALPIGSLIRTPQTIPADTPVEKLKDFFVNLQDTDALYVVDDDRLIGQITLQSLSKEGETAADIAMETSTVSSESHLDALIERIHSDRAPNNIAVYNEKNEFIGVIRANEALACYRKMNHHIRNEERN